MSQFLKASMISSRLGDEAFAAWLAEKNGRSSAGTGFVGRNDIGLLCEPLGFTLGDGGKVSTRGRIDPALLICVKDCSFCVTSTPGQKATADCTFRSN